MKIMFLIGDLAGRGGTERAGCLVASILAREGSHKIAVCSLRRASEPVFPLDSSVRRFDCESSHGSCGQVLKLRRLIDSEAPDLLIDVDSILIYFSAPATWLRKTRLVSWEHFHCYNYLDNQKRRFSRVLMRFFSDKIVTLTEQDAQAYRRCFGWHSDRVQYIFNSSAFPRLKTPSSETGSICLAVGRYSEEKDFSRLIRLWLRALPQLPLGWRLRIVGDGALRPALEAQVAAAGAEARIDLPAFTADIASEYRRASLFCLSSRFEGLPMAMIEAKSFGLPLIALNCRTGPAEIIRHGEDGWLAQDDDEFTSGLIKLTSDTAFREKCSHQALLDERFDAHSVTASWLQFLAKFSAQKRR